MRNILFLCDAIEIQKVAINQYFYNFEKSLNKALDEVLALTEEYQVDTIVCKKKQIALVSRILWMSKCVCRYIIIDTDNALFVEPSNKYATKLWDVVAMQANNPIEQAGFRNSGTNELFSDEEMEAWVNNSVNKLKPYLSSETKVLEIGISGGITCMKVAPRVKEYVGIDISVETLKKTKKRLSERDIHNVTLINADALEIDSLEDGRIECDVIIINSVAQYFPGYNYFIAMIRKATKCIKEKGIIFIGDILDLNLREELFKQMKKNNKNDLFYSRQFIEELPVYIPEIEKVEISNKDETMSENELKKYRYDVILTINKEHKNTKVKRTKYQYAILQKDFSIETII